MAAPRIIVVGAGPAGVRAAETLVNAGLRPIVIDEAMASGGQIYRRQPPGFRRSAQALYGSEASRAIAIHSAFDVLRPSIDYRPHTLAWNLEDSVLHTMSGTTAERLHYDALILACGATDRLLPLPGWTSPGVYSLGASQIALKAQACAIGRRIVFLGTGPLLYLVAAQYVKAGRARLRHSRYLIGIEPAPRPSASCVEAGHSREGRSPPLATAPGEDSNLSRGHPDGYRERRSGQ